VKETVYCHGVAAGGEEEWEFLWGQYGSTALAQERDTIQAALACTGEVPLLYRYLEMCFNPAYIRKQDAGAVFRAIASNDVGRDIAWDYLRDNIRDISRYLNTFTALSDMILAVTEEFNTEQKLRELEDFARDNQDYLGSATLAVDQAVEYVKANIAWMELHYHTVVDWLREQNAEDKVDTDTRPPASIVQNAEDKVDTDTPPPASIVPLTHA